MKTLFLAVWGQPKPQHWSFFREVSSVLHLNCRSRQTKQRGNTQFNRCLCANLSSPQLKCNERLHSFGSLYDGSYLGIGKDATIEVVWGRPFPFRESKSPWVEWLQCSCSLMCSCSDKTSGTVPWSMALQQSSGQGVPSCNAHSSWMCTQCWTLLGSHRFLLKKGPVLWRGLSCYRQ